MAKFPLLRPHILMATIAALSLSACFGSPDVMKRSDAKGSSASTPKRPQMTSAPSFNSPEAQQCAVDLKQAGVKFTPLPNQDHGGGCSSIDAVKLLDIGTPTTNLGAMTCPLARNFAAWAQYAVKPAARKYFGQEVVKIETFGTYSCRNIYGGRSGRLSQHAYSNAVDVSGFVLADGRRIMLDGGWTGDKPSQDFLRALHKSACRRFGTVLSPDYNAAHYNHFHMDMSGAGYCR
ncbi:extensin family protein [Sphingopyxis sp. OPL5]|uniref:extensin family protein n=1 Tax=Sphingopyxis sp. OPL5 TaxID=2486273 RepID=UPI00164EC1D3|nr:extensin family protein [Sphingopyxis sp. OPL5]QNO28432.1 extensin family protein [Sphingopyxis sp. OPL5]